MGKEVVFTDEAFEAEAEMNTEKVAGRENLFAIRVRKGGNYRVFYAYDDGTMVWLLNGYEKKTESIPQNELREAIRLKRKYGL